MATQAKTDGASPEYEKDAYGWAMAQAALIRAGRWSEVDLENVAEEIESVGRSEASRLRSALRVLLVHLLKWERQPERRGRSWALTIKEHRVRFEQVMRDNPGLSPLLPQIVEEAYRRARIEAAREMDVDLDALPETNPFALDDVLNGPREHAPPRP